MSDAPKEKGNRIIWFHGATVVVLRSQLQDDSWVGFDEAGEDSTVRIVNPGMDGAAQIAYAPLNEAHLCPPFTDCPK